MTDTEKLQIALTFIKDCIDSEHPEIKTEAEATLALIEV